MLWRGLVCNSMKIRKIIKRFSFNHLFTRQSTRSSNQTYTIAYTRVRDATRWGEVRGGEREQRVCGVHPSRHVTRDLQPAHRPWAPLAPRGSEVNARGRASPRVPPEATHLAPITTPWLHGRRPPTSRPCAPCRRHHRHREQVSATRHTFPIKYHRQRQVYWHRLASHRSTRSHNIAQMYK